MACFTVTAAAVIGVGVARHIVKHNENKKDPTKVDPIKLDALPVSKKLGVLELALWGGSFILAGEHLIHGEISFKFPWLTAISEGAEATTEMLTEMATAGVGMLLIIVAGWGIGLLVRKLLLKRKAKLAKE